MELLISQCKFFLHHNTIIIDSTTLLSLYKFHESQNDLSIAKRRTFLKFIKKCQVKEDQVYYNGRRMVFDHEIPDILFNFHSNAVGGGHLGRDKTQMKIEERYYWPSIYQHVDQYIKKCSKCQTFNPNFLSIHAPLHPIPVTSVFHQCQIDEVGPLPTTKRGNRYLIVLVDIFSNYTFSKAVPSKDAVNVALFLHEITSMFGFWKILQSDNGKEFINEVIDTYNKLIGAEHRRSTGYHPQTNGKVERTNGTIKTILSKYVNMEGDDWDIYLPSGLFSYVTSVQSSSKMSPFEIMFGRKAQLPYEASVMVQEVQGEETAEEEEDGLMKSGMVKLKDMDEITQDEKDKIIGAITANRKEIQEKVKENMDAAQVKQKAAYDKKNKITERMREKVKTGIYTMLVNKKRGQKFGSLPNTGPYIIAQVDYTKHIVQVQHMEDANDKKWVNMAQLKIIDSETNHQLAQTLTSANEIVYTQTIHQINETLNNALVQLGGGMI